MAKDKYSCLAIYYNNKYVKYAKVSKNQNNTVAVKEHGIKFVRNSIKDTIYDIISETDSKNIPIILNSSNTQYYEFQIFKQIANSDLTKAIKLEFEDWCENNSLIPNEHSYVYHLSDAATGNYRKGLLAISSIKEVDEYSKIGDVNITSIIPSILTTSLAVGKGNENYILFDLDEQLTLSIVYNGKVVEIHRFDQGMKNVLESFEDVLGTYQKAYDSCKQINVFTEDTDERNKVQIEQILEPILQEILAKAMPIINSNKTDINKIILTGLGTLLINMDTLITEYYGIKCEILRPAVISEKNDIDDISELIQATPAISLALQYTFNLAKNVNYIVNAKKEKIKIKKTKNKEEKEKKKRIKFEFDDTLPKKINSILIYPIMIIAIVIISYTVYANIYLDNTNYMINAYNNKINEYELQTTKINSDITTIKLSVQQYTGIITKIRGLTEQIQANEIGKFTTYNVASFMQKIINIIPVGVQITKISSDDNKNITIVASAQSYSTIGYFVANLRLNSDIIKNVSIKDITNGSNVIVEIGGELP